MPESAGPITATRAALVRLLGGGPASVTLAGGVLHIGESSRIPASAVDAVETGPSWFWTRLTIHVAGGVVRAIGGLRRDEAERLARSLREDAARAAAELAPEFTKLSERVERYEATDRYRRHSRSRALPAREGAPPAREMPPRGPHPIRGPQSAARGRGAQNYHGHQRARECSAHTRATGQHGPNYSSISVGLGTTLRTHPCPTRWPTHRLNVR